MPITFLKYNGPKKLRNGSTTMIYASAGGGGGNVTSTTYTNGGYTPEVNLSNYVTLSGQQSLSGIKNFQNGITFGSPIIDAYGNYYFGTLDDETGVGGFLRYDASTDMLYSSLPIDAPNINQNKITGYTYSEIDSSLGLEDISTGGVFNAYTTQQIHKRVYALEENGSKTYQYTDLSTNLNAFTDASVGKSFNAYTVNRLHNRLLTSEESNERLLYTDLSTNLNAFTDVNVGKTFNAYTINKLHNRIYAIETMTQFFEFDASLNAVRCLYPFYTNN